MSSIWTRFGIGFGYSVFFGPNKLGSVSLKMFGSVRFGGCSDRRWREILVNKVEYFLGGDVRTSSGYVVLLTYIRFSVQ